MWGYGAHGLIVGGEVRMFNGFGGGDALCRVELKETVEEVTGWSNEGMSVTRIDERIEYDDSTLQGSLWKNLLEG